MKKSNVILQSAVAFVLGAATVGSAQAGTLATTFTTYASELFGKGSEVTPINPKPITYQFGVPVAASTAGQTISIYIQINNGAKFVTGKVAAADLSGTDAAGLHFGDAGGPFVVSVQYEKDSANTFVVFTVNTGKNGFNTNSTLTFTPQSGSVTSLKDALSADGGTVTVTWTNDSGAASTTAVPTGSTNIDAGGVHTGPVAQAAAAIKGTIVASDKFTADSTLGTVPESKKIDLSASPVATKFSGAPTNTPGSDILVNLGYISFSNVSGLQDDGTGTDYTVNEPSITGINAVVTGDFTALGTTGKVFVSVNKADGSAPDPAAASYSKDKKTASFSGITKPAKSGDKYYILYQTDGKSAIPVQSPTANAALVKTAVSNQLDDTVSDTSLYPLVQNGALVDVRTFIGASTGSGYNGWLRLVNTGTLDAPVNVALIAEDGTVGKSSVLVSSLKAGGATLVSAADVDKALGSAIKAGTYPRLRLSAATNGLVVQSLLQNPNGTFTDISSAQASQTGLGQQNNPQ